MQIKVLVFFAFIFGQIGTCLAGAPLPSDCHGYKVTQDGIEIQKHDLKEMGLRSIPGDFSYHCEDKSAKGMCVRWDDINVQSHGQAIALAKQYAKHTNNVDIVCSRGYFTCGVSDRPHIVCVANNPKWNKDYYEFVFNDIHEQADKKWRKGVGTASCKTFLGSNITISKAEYKDKTMSYADAMRCNVECNDSSSYSKNLERNQDKCMLMNDSLRDNFGFSVLYDGNYNRYMIDSNGCSINFGSVNSYTQSRRTCNDMLYNATYMNNERFATLQGQLNTQMIMWLAGYVQRELDEPLTSFDCKYAFSACSTGDIKNPTDDILQCTANGKKIMFRFDDLSETGSGQLKKTDAAMKCMNTENGSFDGRRCRGLSRTQCTDLSSQVPGGTKWDDDLDACVLKAANAQANRDRALDITLTIGIPATLIVVEVATGGGATPVVFAGVGMVTAGVSESMTTYQRNKMQEHLTKLEKCTTAKCVKVFLDDYFSTLSSYEYNMPGEVIDTLDEILAKKLTLLTAQDAERFINKIEEVRKKDSYWNTFLSDEHAEWTVRDTQAVLNVVSIISDFIPISNLAIKATKKVSGLARMPKTARQIKTIWLGGVKKITTRGLDVNNAAGIHDAANQ